MNRLRRLTAEAHRLGAEETAVLRCTAARIAAQQGGSAALAEACFPPAPLSGAQAAALDRALAQHLRAEDLRTPQLLGWLFQCYRSEAQRRLFDSPGRVRAEDVPLRTQVFTPDWLARYLTENTLGALYRARFPQSRLTLRYLVPPPDEGMRGADLSFSDLRELSCADLSCGTGHLLLAFFDLLLAMYREQGVGDSEAVERLMAHNLAGTELDPQAARVARFVLLLRAVQVTGHLPEARPQVRVCDDRLLGSLARAAHEPRYAAVAMNPPFMERKVMPPDLQAYIDTHYPEGRADLMTAFMLRAEECTLEGGRWAVLNLPSWLSLRSFEGLRRRLAGTQHIASLLHLGRGVFGADFGSVALTVQKAPSRGCGVYRRLFDEHGRVRPCEAIRQKFLTPGDGRYVADQRDFLKLPGALFGYWLEPALIRAFDRFPRLGDRLALKQGLATTDNARFLRLWYEVPRERICPDAATAEAARRSGKSWFPYNKGGAYCKWYGNTDYIINWAQDGRAVTEAVCARYPYLHGKTDYVIKNRKFYFRECLTWSKVTAGDFSVRRRPAGSLFDVAGCCGFADDPRQLLWAAGFLNSAVAKRLLHALSPTINYEVGAVAALPLAPADAATEKKVIRAVQRCIADARATRAEQETAPEFTTHPLAGAAPLREACCRYRRELTARQRRLRRNEAAIDRIMASLYGLSAPPAPAPEPLPTDAELVKSYVSYAVGCCLGRFGDGCGILADAAPVLARSGADTPFIEEQLGMPLRHYLREDFYRDHLQRYSLKGAGARPIYLLFRSRGGAFRALVYLHRMTADTLSTLCRDYLEPRLAQLPPGPEREDCLDYRERLRAVAAAKKLCPDPDAGVLANAALFGDLIAPLRPSARP